MSFLKLALAATFLVVAAGSAYALNPQPLPPREMRKPPTNASPFVKAMALSPYKARYLTPSPSSRLRVK